MGSITFFVILVLFIIDGQLAKSWVKPYYQFGLPIYIRKIKVRSMRRIPAASQIRGRLPLKKWPPLFMAILTPNSIAIREERLGWRGATHSRVPPMMHGLITFDEANQQLVVKGIANWSACAMLLLIPVGLPLVVIFGWNDIRVEDLGLYMLFFAVFTTLAVYTYVSQRQRLNHIAEIAVMQWQRR